MGVLRSASGTAPQRPASRAVQKTITPDVALPAHNSPLDFAFYTGTQFPAEYRGGAFITASWHLEPLAARRIQSRLRAVSERQTVRTAKGFSDRLDDCAGEQRCVGDGRWA
jgi:glucose/arabinose dehydrogenase